jgi:DNA mismatch repair ATPase MutS
MASFMQSYFDQAAEVAGLLNIKLTSRKWDGQTILMCGFPIFHLQKHLKTLIQQNHRFVALCEEFARPTLPGAKPSYDRRVARIVTPGTLIDELFLNRCENNYLMAITPASSSPLKEDNDLGLAWIDVSTGEFFTKSTTVESLSDDIVRVHPREVVLLKAMESIDSCPVRAIVREEGIVVSYFDTSSPTHLPPLSHPLSVPDVPVSPRRPAPSVHSSQEGSAVGLLTCYLRSNLLEHMPSLSVPNKEVADTRMEIDAHTLKSLEIREGAQERRAAGTLLSCVKRTVTSGGSRLLSRWLCTSPPCLYPFFKADNKLTGSPSASLQEINTRQSIVAFFHTRTHLRRDLRDHLRGVDDVTRVVQKFLLGRANIDDIGSISTALSVWSIIKSRLSLERELDFKEGDCDMEQEWASIDALISRMGDLPQLERKIRASMNGSPTGLGSPLETTEDAITTHEPSEDDKWQQGCQWSINPE